MTGLLLRGAEVDGRLVNVAVAGARIVSVGPGVAAPAGARTVDARGGALLPGLHDHHVHLLALAASRQSVDVSPATTPDAPRFAAALAEAAARTPAGQWVRAVGYHERVAGELDRWRLDAVAGDRPLRVQHRSGALWVLNSAALSATGLLQGSVPAGCLTDERGEPTGRMFRLDEWLGRRIPRLALDLSLTGRAMAGFGFTGATDATPYRDTESMTPLAEAVDAGALPLDVMVMGSPALDPGRIPLALRPGPAKLLLPDHELPTPHQIAAWIWAARRFGRPVAVHCVTGAALVVTLSALAETGGVKGDRIEHGAVVGAEVRPQLRESGVTLVTQPGFVAERGDDYLADVAPEEHADLWPVASLLAAGIPVAAGTDAPYGRPDPWALLHAAATRRTQAGRTLGRRERVDARRALDLLLGPADRPGGPPRRVAAGAPADLCLLAHPLREALAQLPDNPVRATFRTGQLTYGDPE
jgi:predicted amidohydrolase YtcJ